MLYDTTVTVNGVLFNVEIHMLGDYDWEVHAFMGAKSYDSWLGEWPYNTETWQEALAMSLVVCAECAEHIAQA